MAGVTLIGHCMKFLTSTFGLFIINLTYLFLGAWLFLAIEAPREESLHNNLEGERDSLVDSIITLGQGPEEYYKGNASEKLASYEVSLANFYRKRATFKLASGNESVQDLKLWTPAGAIIYCYSVITTIGWGNIVPATVNGRLGTVIYGLNGMPLLFTLSSEVGSTCSSAIFAIWGHFRKLIQPLIQDKKPTKKHKSILKKRPPTPADDDDDDDDEGDDDDNESNNERKMYRYHEQYFGSSTNLLRGSRSGITDDTLNAISNNHSSLRSRTRQLNSMYLDDDSFRFSHNNSEYLCSVRSCIDYILYACSEARSGRTPKYLPHYRLRNRQDALLLCEQFSRMSSDEMTKCMEYVGFDYEKEVYCRAEQTISKNSDKDGCMHTSLVTFNVEDVAAFPREARQTSLLDEVESCQQTLRVGRSASHKPVLSNYSQIRQEYTEPQRSESAINNGKHISRTKDSLEHQDCVGISSFSDQVEHKFGFCRSKNSAAHDKIMAMSNISCPRGTDVLGSNNPTGEISVHKQLHQDHVHMCRTHVNQHKSSTQNSCTDDVNNICEPRDTHLFRCIDSAESNPNSSTVQTLKTRNRKLIQSKEVEENVKQIQNYQERKMCHIISPVQPSEKQVHHSSRSTCTSEELVHSSNTAGLVRSNTSVSSFNTRERDVSTHLKHIGLTNKAIQTRQNEQDELCLHGTFCPEYDLPTPIQRANTESGEFLSTCSHKLNSSHLCARNFLTKNDPIVRVMPNLMPASCTHNNEFSNINKLSPAIKYVHTPRDLCQTDERLQDHRKMCNLAQKHVQHKIHLKDSTNKIDKSSNDNPYGLFGLVMKEYSEKSMVDASVSLTENYKTLTATNQEHYMKQCPDSQDVILDSEGNTQFHSISSSEITVAKTPVNQRNNEMRKRLWTSSRFRGGGEPFDCLKVEPHTQETCYTQKQKMTNHSENNFVMKNASLLHNTADVTSSVGNVRNIPTSCGQTFAGSSPRSTIHFVPEDSTQEGLGKINSSDYRPNCRTITPIQAACTRQNSQNITKDNGIIFRKVCERDHLKSLDLVETNEQLNRINVSESTSKVTCTSAQDLSHTSIQHMSPKVVYNLDDASLYALSPAQDQDDDCTQGLNYSLLNAYTSKFLQKQSDSVPISDSRSDRTVTKPDVSSRELSGTNTQSDKHSYLHVPGYSKHTSTCYNNTKVIRSMDNARNICVNEFMSNTKENPKINITSALGCVPLREEIYNHRPGSHTCHVVPSSQQDKCYTMNIYHALPMQETYATSLPGLMYTRTGRQSGIICSQNFRESQQNSGTIDQFLSVVDGFALRDKSGTFCVKATENTSARLICCDKCGETGNVNNQRVDVTSYEVSVHSKPYSQCRKNAQCEVMCLPRTTFVHLNSEKQLLPDRTFMHQSYAQSGNKDICLTRRDTTNAELPRRYEGRSVGIQQWSDRRYEGRSVGIQQWSDTKFQVVPVGFVLKKEQDQAKQWSNIPIQEVPVNETVKEDLTKQWSNVQGLSNDKSTTERHTKQWTDTQRCSNDKSMTERHQIKQCSDYPIQKHPSSLSMAEKQWSNVQIQKHPSSLSMAEKQWSNVQIQKPSNFLSMMEKQWSNIPIQKSSTSFSMAEKQWSDVPKQKQHNSQAVKEARDTNMNYDEIEDEDEDEMCTIYSSGRGYQLDEDLDDEEFISGIGFGFNAKKAKTFNKGKDIPPLILYRNNTAFAGFAGMGHLIKDDRKTAPVMEKFRMPLFFLYSLIILYVFFGSLVFYTYETKIEFWDALYFIYVLLSTTGFGDILPKPSFYAFIVVYATIGMAIYNIMINATLELFLEVLEYLASFGEETKKEGYLVHKKSIS